MATAVIVTVCSLLLIAYLFDLTALKTKIPSVIMFLLLGWLVRRASRIMDIPIPDLYFLLPVLGTIGLILIVLEGSLELELNASKAQLIKKSFVVALLGIILLALGLALALHYWGGATFRQSIINAIPFCVISSSIAIPSARSLSSFNKEFVVYESSLSDIIGVFFFNFFAYNSIINLSSVGNFALDLVILVLVSFVATIILAFLISNIQHHVKFGPIILLVILIFVVSKVYHLPALLFILLFGLFLGNLNEFSRFKWIQKLQPDILNREVHKFKELIMEATFLIRAMFFLLFGYLITLNEIQNLQTLTWAVGIVAGIFFSRAILLLLMKLPLLPLLFVAPRGLITILLFLSIEPIQRVFIINKSLIIQVVILSALVMMVGFLVTGKEKKLPQKVLIS